MSESKTNKSKKNAVVAPPVGKIVGGYKKVKKNESKAVVNKKIK